MTLNIDTLIKDLFHNPPSYKSLVNLSWKSEQVGYFIFKSIDGFIHLFINYLNRNKFHRLMMLH